MTVNAENCVGCGRCIGACNFDAISFEDSAATKVLNSRMAEYTKAVLDGRPNFHISLVVDVSPNCDCHPENDAPILPNIGMFASFDPLALDKACVDACLKMTRFPTVSFRIGWQRNISVITTIILKIQRQIPNIRRVLHMRRRSVSGQESMN